MATISSDWQTLLADFERALEKRGGFHGLRDLCHFMMDEHWDDGPQVLEFLTGYLTVLEAKMRFHERWSEKRQLKRVAEFERRDYEELQGFIQQLTNL